MNKKIDIENDTDLKSQVNDSSKTKEFTKKKREKVLELRLLIFQKKKKRKFLKIKHLKLMKLKTYPPKEEEKRNGWWNQ